MTPEEKETLEHEVLDAEVWDVHQRAHFIAKHGIEEGTKIADANLAAKVKRILEKTDYLLVKNSPDYKNRATRDAEEKVVRDAEMAARLAELQQQEQRKRDEIAALVNAEVTRILNERNENVR